MLYKEIPIQTNGSAPDTKLVTYILDTPGEHIKIRKRPAVILCPGGGYELTSYREGEPLAMHFLSKGYHVGVLRYSICPARFPTALLELGIAMSLFHEHAEEWKVDTDHIIVQGSSAGGHLAGCLGVFWNRQFLTDILGISSSVLRPAGLILSYPVITADEAYAHMGSFQNLLGDEFYKEKENLSLEKQVGPHMPPCFIWHTFEDRTVPVENTLLLAMALKKAKVPAEIHIFQKGIHGLGLASELVEKPDGSGVQKECQCWVDLADVWLNNL